MLYSVIYYRPMTEGKIQIKQTVIPKDE